MNHIFSQSVQGNYKSLIQQDINKRDIKYLFHFTPVSNLQSIFQNGLRPRTTLIENKNQFTFNDDIRVDNHPNSLSLSISFPNYKMFYKYRIAKNAPDMAVLAIRPSVIIEKDCAFYSENAARNIFNNQPANNFKNWDSWQEMFSNRAGIVNRSSLNLPNNFTTHPQAEILVFDDIQPEYIIGVLFENQATMNKYKHTLPQQANCQVQEWVYKPRSDYEHWQSN